MPPPPYSRIAGKTYSLFGVSDSTDGYYRTMNRVLDELLYRQPDPSEWIKLIRMNSWKKRKLTRMLTRPVDNRLLSVLVHRLHEELSVYTSRVEHHMEGLSIKKKLLDHRLGTTREQYHLYMLEIAFTNRLNREKFIRADYKMGLLPYCLQDFSSRCKAEEVDGDYRCKHCSGFCYENFISRILKKHQVDPYIWKGSGIRDKFNGLEREGKTLGILGIACLPELAWGLRLCTRLRIPAIGIPLDGNCCVRWFGEFRENSLNLKVLEELVS
jgi:hypothetical protein